MSYQMRLTSFLFPAPSPLFAAGQILDLAGSPQLYNESPTEDEADFLALLRDWAVVGEDLRKAIEEFEQSLVRD